MVEVDIDFDNNRLPRFLRLNQKGRDEMSATMLVHVPVDEIEIVRGSLSYRELFYFMGLTDEKKSIEMNVTLRTRASRQVFRRKLTITSVPFIACGRRSNNRATIIGTFAGRPIQGEYRTKSRKGTFRLAD